MDLPKVMQPAMRKRGPKPSPLNYPVWVPSSSSQPRAVANSAKQPFWSPKCLREDPMATPRHLPWCSSPRKPHHGCPLSPKIPSAGHTARSQSSSCEEPSLLHFLCEAGKAALAIIFLTRQLPDKRIKAGGFQKSIKNNLKRNMLMLV